jgi:hypothetical protein
MAMIVINCREELALPGKPSELVQATGDFYGEYWDTD